MAGGYKSYLMHPGLIVALCIHWILLPQIHLISKLSYHDGVLFDTRLIAAACSAQTIANGHVSNTLNRSCDHIKTKTKISASIALTTQAKKIKQKFCCAHWRHLRACTN